MGKKVGRNEPCPCGSGKKYKRCCLEADGLVSSKPSCPSTQRGASPKEERSMMEALFCPSPEAHLNQLLSVLPQQLRFDFEWLRVCSFWKMHNDSLSADVANRMDGYPEIQKSLASSPIRPFLEGPLKGGLHPYLMLFAKDITLSALDQDPRTFFDVQELLSDQIRSVFRSRPPRLAFFTGEVGPQVNGLLEKTAEALSRASMSPEARALAQKSIMACESAHLLSLRTVSANAPTRWLHCREVRMDEESATASEAPSTLVPWVATELPQGHAMRFEMFGVIVSVTLSDGSTQDLVFPLAPHADFEPGFGAFAMELARQTEIPLLQVVLSLMQNPLFRITARTRLDPDQMPRVFMDHVENGFGRRDQALERAAAEVRTVLQAARFLLAESALRDSHFARIQAVLQESGRGGNLETLLHCLWMRLETASPYCDVFGYPKTSQVLSVVFGPSKKGRASAHGKASNTSNQAGPRRTILVPAWTSERERLREALPDQLRLATVLDRAKLISNHLIKSRGYKLPEPLQIRVGQDSDVVLNGAGELSLAQSLLLGPFVHVEEAIRWAHFQILTEQYLKETRSLEEAQNLAAQRTGLVLSDWLRIQGKRCSSADMAADPLADRTSSEQRILEKAEKLFRLANSGNTAEAELAMQRAHELLEKLRYESLTAELGADNPVFEVWEGQGESSEILGGALKTMRTLTYYLGNAREQRVASAVLNLVAAHYGVLVVHRNVYNSATAKEEKGADVLGPKVSVLMSEHVIEFLCRQLDTMWLAAKRKDSLENYEKLSFKLGVIDGFWRKIEKQKASRPAAPHKAADQGPDLFSMGVPSKEDALVALAIDATEAYRDLRYARLKSRSSRRYSLYTAAFRRGKDKGGELSMHTPLENATTSTGRGSGRTALIEGALH